MSKHNWCYRLIDERVDNDTYVNIEFYNGDTTIRSNKIEIDPTEGISTDWLGDSLLNMFCNMLDLFNNITIVEQANEIERLNQELERLRKHETHTCIKDELIEQIDNYISNVDGVDLMCNSHSQYSIEFQNYPNVFIYLNRIDEIEFFENNIFSLALKRSDENTLSYLKSFISKYSF
jgi:hypothetical protein